MKWEVTLRPLKCCSSSKVPRSACASDQYLTSLYSYGCKMSMYGCRVPLLLSLSVSIRSLQGSLSLVPFVLLTAGLGMSSMAPGTWTRLKWKENKEMANTQKCKESWDGLEWVLGWRKFSILKAQPVLFQSWRERQVIVSGWTGRWGDWSHKEVGFTVHSWIRGNSICWGICKLGISRGPGSYGGRFHHVLSTLAS